MSNKRLILGLTFLFTLASCSSSSEDTENTPVGEWTDFVEDSGNGDNTQATKAKYQVFFYNGSTELFHTSVIEGRKVSYGGSQPKKDSTPTIKYIFVGWSEDPDADYTKALSVDKLPGIVKDSKFYAIF